MRYVGVDGAPDGWLSVCYEGEQFEEARHFSDISEVWSEYLDAETILIDVPIGLREDSSEPRRCDTVARSKLSPNRHSSVFPTPIRAAVKSDDYETAKGTQEDRTDGSLGTQTWAISGKIAQLDKFLRETEEAQQTVREAHPELCFWALNGGQAMVHSKTGAPLMAFWERVETLEQVDEDILSDIQAAGGNLETDASNDDLLDAFALAVTASPLTGDLQTVPEEPEFDPKDLPMEMVYAKAGD